MYIKNYIEFDTHLRLYISFTMLITSNQLVNNFVYFVHLHIIKLLISVKNVLDFLNTTLDHTIYTQNNTVIILSVVIFKLILYTKLTEKIFIFNK